ncbi:copper homeostasis protein CutC [Flagellimonas zhangzhouensis]|uniref:PF03932 family protein CutC n=1 Tax=Flagellimonas zhangzhouensis TaxID=1073328 RepID=A0A1H2WWV6_9FLAO|nr:copper homeostasis protein CutC [Allomuricauda zhangzhouensis]SDQ25708.1 copper homeostasis protein [Allomuricauda zhangzhouensis]SDW85133.1 copper homeostasis protein [Allomuricauda zhangzhouensis]
MLVEVCANSLESAVNAERAGADRIELCSELGVGGITPSAGLIRLVKKELNIPVHVLLRPRGGHFTYSDYEFEVMKADILACKEMGVDGIVSGILDPDFTVDIERTKVLVELSGELHFVFHRAFDWVANPSKAIKQLESIGVQTVLTSGGKTSAELGLKNLKTWQQQTTMTIMAGGGVSSANALKFKNEGLIAIHCSGSSFQNAVNISNKISMNSSKHLVEDQVAVSNPEVLKAIVAAVK